MGSDAATTATGTRWLSAAEQEVWREYLSATQLLAARLESQLQADAGIPMAYYEILVRLSESPERALRMSELSENCLQSRSRISHAAAKLEERGWIERRQCATDGRGAVAVLTDAGFAALEAAAPGHVETVRSELFDRLSPEQVEQLRAIASAIAEPLR